MTVFINLLKYLLLYILLLSLSPKSVQAITYFFDDFSDASFSQNNWLKTDTYDNPNTSIYPNWMFDNGYCKAVTNNVGNQSNQLLLSNWSYNFDNYTISFDFIRKDGSDINAIFNYALNNWFYEVHFSGSLVLLKKSGYLWPNGNDTYTNNYPVENNVLHNFKIDIYGSNITISIRRYNDPYYTVLFDITDNTCPRWSGKTGLRGGTGADTYLNIWFDNFKVDISEPLTPLNANPCNIPMPTLTPTPTSVPTPTSTPTSTITPTPNQNIPLVLVPGLGASINFKEMFLGVSNPDGWRLTPGSGIYDNIIDLFNGDPNFYVFYYDWRKPITESANSLYQFIQSKFGNSVKINVIGHSLGGLVSRACLQTKSNNCQINKLITVGSPHYGAIDAYPLLEAGEIWRTGISKVALEILIHYYQSPGSTKRETLQRIAPVLYDLLPTFNYLSINNTPLDINDLSIKNNFLPIINTNISIFNNHIITVYGNGLPTIETINLTQADWLNKLLNNWPDGKVLEKSYTNNGDKTVLVKSATFSNQLIPKIEYSLDHGQLMSKIDPIREIINILSINKPIGDLPSKLESKNYLVFLAHSPISVNLSNPPKDIYKDDNLVIIPDPEDSTYSIDLSGTDCGDYILSVGEIYSETTSWHDYYNSICSSDMYRYDFDISSQHPYDDPLIDADGSNSKTQLDNRIVEFNSEIINLTNVPSDNKNLFLRRLQEIYSSANYQKSINLIHLLRTEISHWQNQEIIDKITADTLRTKTKFLINEVIILANLTQTGNFAPTAKSMLNKAKRDEELILHDKNLSSNGAFLFVEGQERQIQGEHHCQQNQYFLCSLLSQVASNIYLEAKLLK